jgi:hypothetical protein
MDEITLDEVLQNKIDKTSPDYGSLSLESLALLINTERLKRLEDRIVNEFVELKKRQDQVIFLHKLIKTINIATENGAFDCSNNAELQKLMTKAQEYGVNIKTEKFKYTSDERERLIDNIRMTADDYNVLNDMQLQTVTRFITERYESYQLARSIMKPLHDDKTNKARAIAGR